MADKAKKDNKNLIIGICAAVVVVVVIIVAVVLATRGSSSINDDYFVSDGTKYVLTIDTESEESTNTNSESAKYTPLKVHYVYTYSGDKITGLKAYYVYADADKAAAALSYVKDESGKDYKEIITDGKYIVLISNESDYESVTPQDVKSQIDFIESIKNMNLNNNSDDNSSDSSQTETTEETK